MLSEDLDAIQTEQFIHNVKQDNNIEYIEEDKELGISSVPNLNPAYQWDMADTGGFLKEPKWSGDNFANAWIMLDNHGYFPGENVTVAVLDTGYTPHPNFINNLQTLNGTAGIYGYKFISDCRKSGECPACTNSTAAKNDPHSKYTPDGLDLGDFITAKDITCPLFNKTKQRNSSWHGSHVIGTIVSNGYNTNNIDYMTGGACGAMIIPVRVMGKDSGKVSDIVDGMMWAVGFVVSNVDGSQIPINPNPAQVISMSLSGVGLCSRPLQDAINIAVGNDVIVVVAAGNNQVDIKTTYPANCDNVISVAAKGPTGKLAYYSNFGNTTITASGGDRTILSPLSMVKSTTWSSLEAYQLPSAGGQGIWTEMQGTSMATPHVSAAIAVLISVLKAQGKPYTPKEVINILQKSAVKYNGCNAFGCATNYTLNMEKAADLVLESDSTWLPSTETLKAIFPYAGVSVVSATIGGIIVYCFMRQQAHLHAQ